MVKPSKHELDIYLNRLEIDQKDLHQSVIDTLKPFSSELDGGSIKLVDELVERTKKLHAKGVEKIEPQNLTYVNAFPKLQQLEDTIIIHRGFKSLHQLLKELDVDDTEASLFHRLDKFYEARELYASLRTYGTTSNSPNVRVAIEEVDMDALEKKMMAALRAYLESSVVLTDSGDALSMRLKVRRDLERSIKTLSQMIELENPFEYELRSHVEVKQQTNGTSQPYTIDCSSPSNYISTLRRWLITSLVDLISTKTILSSTLNNEDDCYVCLDIALTNDEPTQPIAGFALLNRAVGVLPESITGIWTAEDDYILRRQVFSGCVVLLLQHQSSAKQMDSVSSALEKWGLHKRGQSFISTIKSFLSHKYLSLLAERESVQKMDQELSISERIWECGAGSAYVPPSDDASEKLAKYLMISSTDPLEIEECVITHSAFTMAIALNGLREAISQSKELTAEYFDMIETPVKLFLASLSGSTMNPNTAVTNLYFLLNVLARQRVQLNRGSRVLGVVAAMFKKKIDLFKVSLSTTVPTSFSAVTLLEALMNEQKKLELEVNLMDYVRSLHKIRAELNKLPRILEDKVFNDIAAKLIRDFDDTIICGIRMLMTADADISEPSNTEPPPSGGPSSSGLMKGFIQRLSEPSLKRSVKKMVGINNNAVTKITDEDLLIRLSVWTVAHSAPGPSHFVDVFEALLAHCSNILDTACESASLIPKSVDSLLSRVHSSHKRAVLLAFQDRQTIM